MADSRPRKRLTKNLSLRRVDIQALEYLARQDAHENTSAAARKLIDQRMRAEIGREWEAVIGADVIPGESEKASVAA